MKIRFNFTLKFLLLFALLFEYLPAQVCVIPMDYIFPKQVKNNKIKEMLVYYGDQHKHEPYLHFLCVLLTPVRCLEFIACLLWVYY